MLGSLAEVRCGGAVVDAAIEVHRELGPGLLEGVYVECLTDALARRHRTVRREVVCPVTYRGRTFDRAYRLDMIVDDLVVVEVKSVREVTRVHAAQLLSYLKLSGFRVGLLLNFNCILMKHGIVRRYNFDADRHLLRQSSASPC